MTSFNTKIKILIAVLVFFFGMQAIYAAWTGPTTGFPDGNTSAPLNVSSEGQSKSGGLILNTGGADNGLLVYGTSSFDGNVGIGIVTPTSKLQTIGAGAPAINWNNYPSTVEKPAIAASGKQVGIFGTTGAGDLCGLSSTRRIGIIGVGSGDICTSSTFPKYAGVVAMHDAYHYDGIPLVAEITGNRPGAGTYKIASFRTGNTETAYFGNGGVADTHYFEVGPGKFVIQKGTGNVGIGTTTPAAKLHIAGTAGVDGIKFPDGTLQTTAADASGGFQMSFISSNSASFSTNGGSSNILIPSDAKLAIVRQCLYMSVREGQSDCMEAQLTFTGKTSGGRSVKMASYPVDVSINSTWNAPNIYSNASDGGFNAGTADVTVYFYK